MLGNGDDGVLLVRLGAVVTQAVLYRSFESTGVRESAEC